MEEYDKNLSRLRNTAKENGLVLNPDAERLQKVVGGMTENFKKHGDYFCPCKRKNDPPVTGEDTLCPCSEMANEIEKDGHCFCKLFFTPEAARQI